MAQQPPQHNQAPSDNQLLGLIKQISPALSSKVIKDAHRQLSATENLIKKLDELVAVYKKTDGYQTERRGGIIGNAIKDRKDQFLQSLNLDSILRKIINPLHGSITSNILDGLEKKRLDKERNKMTEKEYKENFLSNTMLGRTVDPKSKAGKELANKEWERFRALDELRRKKELEIGKKENFARKFGGVGGPSKKDLDELQRINNTIKANSIRINEGKKAEQEFLSGKIAPNVDQNNSGENISAGVLGDDDILIVLKQIEANTRGDSISADDIEKDRESRIKPQAGPSQKIDIINPKDLKAAEGSGGGFFSNMFGSIFKSIKGVVSKLFSPRLLLRAITKVFAPAMLIGSIFNGFKDGIKEYMESGDLSKSIIAGIGGFVEFITFGLFDKDSVQGAADYISEKAGELWEGAKSVFSDIVKSGKEIFDNLIKNIKDFAKRSLDSVKEFFGFGESKKEIILPEEDAKSDKAAIDKAKKEYKVASKEEKKQIISTTGMSKTELSMIGKIKDQSAISAKKSRDEIDNLKYSEKQKGTGSTVVAPVLNTSSTTNVHQKAPVRNTEASVNRYLANI